jgi:HlyD family secretion protein
MNIIAGIKKRILSVKNYFLKASLWKKIIILVIIIGLGIGVRQIIVVTQTKKVTYQTAKAAKGTLTTSISSTGTITSGNSTDITTKVSGTVSKVYVTNGDTVTKGQKIADVTLDDYAQERQAAAWVAYLDAVEAVKDAQTTKETADIQMWNDRQAYIDAQDAVTYKNGIDINTTTNKEYTATEKAVIDKTLSKTASAFSSSQTKYLDADANIANAQAKVASALRDYQANSATIVAPSAGIVSNLVLAEGVAITASSSTSSTNGSTIISSQSVGKINDPEGQLIATVNLAEADIINVKANQKVTLTLDAYSDKTFTGKVLSINTSGSVSSGVTTYPVTIILDKTDTIIYLNMAVSATIITSIKTNVLLIETTAIDTENSKSIVHVLKDGKVSSVEVTTGSSDDTQTEITKGLSEGDAVITNYISATDASQNNTTSSFSTTSKTSTSSKSSSGGMGGGMMGGPPGM